MESISRKQIIFCHILLILFIRRACGSRLLCLHLKLLYWILPWPPKTSSFSLAEILEHQKKTSPVTHLNPKTQSSIDVKNISGLAVSKTPVRAGKQLYFQSFDITNKPYI